MALVLADRVKETSTTTGTGTLTLAGAATGFQSFAVIGNGNTCYYTITNQAAPAEWEVGIGTYTLAGTTLARTTILASSNAGAVVTLSAGTKDVFVTYPAGRAVYGDGVVLAAPSGALLPVANGGTGLASVASTRIPYGNGTGALNTSANLNYNGTSFIVGAATAPTFTGASSQPYSYVVANSLATTLNATSDLLSLGNSNGNQNYLRMFQYRNTAAGADWTTATTKIQAITDVTGQGYIEFNPKSGTYGIAFGNGSTEYVRILNGGAISFGATGTATGTSGQVLTSAGSGASPTWAAAPNKTTTGLWENAATISANYSITAGNNAISAGPVTIAAGVVVTVPSGSVWVVV